MGDGEIDHEILMLNEGIAKSAQPNTQKRMLVDNSQRGFPKRQPAFTLQIAYASLKRFETGKHWI